MKLQFVDSFFVLKMEGRRTVAFANFVLSSWESFMNTVLRDDEDESLPSHYAELVQVAPLPED